MVGTGLTETHKFREPVGALPGADYREVSFKARDGVKLSGWYRPTRNGATVIALPHGGGGHRGGALAHARMLARHGYGVLLYDARGRGRSEGCAELVRLGLGRGRRRRAHVPAPAAGRRSTRSRIGGLGPSTGADALIGPGAQPAGCAPWSPMAPHAESFEDWRRMQGIDPVDARSSRSRVRHGPDHLGGVTPGRIDGGDDQTRHRPAAAAGLPGGGASTSTASTSSTTPRARPARSRSSTGTCRTRTTPTRLRGARRLRAARGGLPRRGADVRTATPGRPLPPQRTASCPHLQDSGDRT